MNTGIQILLKRMESHPEEFYYKPNEGVGKWTKLLDTFKRSLTQEEIDAIDEGLRKIERERFTELVMQALAGVEDEPSDTGKYYATPLSLIGSNNNGLGYQALSTITTGHHNSVIGNLAPNYATLTIGNTTLNEEQLKHMKAHMDALAKVEVRKKATLR
jgi:hypothetical protein